MTTYGALLRAAAPALVLAGAQVACGPGASPIARQERAPDTAASAPAFANRAWRVGASATIERGMLYVFLGDGTLLLASAHGTPSLGRWESAAGGIVLIEEGQRYPTDVLTLTQDTFAIRMHSPGEPVDITLVPAR